MEQSPDEVPASDGPFDQLSAARPSTPLNTHHLGPVSEAPLDETDSPAEEDMDLLYHVNYIRKLLVRQKRDLGLVSSATAAAAGLVAARPRLPGRSALAALADTLAALADTLAASVSSADAALGVAADLKAMVRPAAGRVGAGGPSDQASGGAWPGEDPFTDSPAAETRPSTTHALAYHSDITALAWPRVYADAGSPGPAAPQSRRVVLSNLPPGASVAQVLRGVGGFGAVVSATAVSGLGARAAVEFVYPASAAACVARLRARPLALLGADSSAYAVRAWLVPTHSHPLSARVDGLLRRGATRALALCPVPVGAVWELLRSLAPRRVTATRYQDEALVVEFASLIDTELAAWTVKALSVAVHRSPWALCARVVPDSSQGRLADVPAVVGFIPADHVERQWNRAPFSQAPKPADDCASASSRPASPSASEKLAEALSVSPSALSDLADRATRADTEYRIFGSAVTLTRRAWGWRISAADDDKLLMANTLHEPAWADEWDRHFAARGAVNLRTWERYGMLARHRRDKAAEQGLELWRVPRCVSACEWRCGDLKAAPVPAVVADYLRSFLRRPGALQE